MASDPSYGMAGVFFFKGLVIISSGPDHEHGWEHVSVSTKDRTPSWEEMCWVKGQFWEDDEAVMQLHPPKANYVNNHSHCLHLWRPLWAVIPLPPPLLVGYKELGTLA